MAKPPQGGIHRAANCISIAPKCRKDASRPAGTALDYVFRQAAGVAVDLKEGIVTTQNRSLFLRTLDRTLIAAALLMALVLFGVQITHAS